MVSNNVTLIGLQFGRYESQQYGNRIKIVFQPYTSILEYFDDIVSRSNDTQLEKRKMERKIKIQKFRVFMMNQRKKYTQTGDTKSV